MLAEKRNYAYDYNMDSTARKKEQILYDNPYNVKLKKKVQKKKSTNKQISKKTQVLTIFWMLSIFSILMIIIYRFNIISEKNLEVQNLKNKLLQTQANVANAQVDVEKSIDINKIESYAKQQLGMQKPDKNQTIYIDNSNNDSVQIENNTTKLENIMNKLQQMLNQLTNNIF